jgi:HEAT repeat protein
VLETLRVLSRESQALGLLGVVGLALAGLSLAFVAYAVVRRLATDRKARRRKELERRWEEPVLAAMSDPEALPALWDRVERRDRLVFVDYVLRFARRVRGDERALLEKAAAPYLDLLTPRLSHRQTAIRVRAVQTLGHLGLPRFTDAVLRALDDPTTLVAMVAARALARPAYDRHAHELVRRLERFHRWSRGYLASLLAGIGPTVAEELRSTLADTSRPPWVRAVAAEALRHLADPAAAAAAVAVVEGEDDRELVAAALRLLTRVGGPDQAAAVRGLTGSGDFVIRCLALTTLGELGGEEDVPLLLEAVGDPSPWVAIHAARALRAGGRTDALAALAEETAGERATTARQLLEELSVGGGAA